MTPVGQLRQSRPSTQIPEGDVAAGVVLCCEEPDWEEPDCDEPEDEFEDELEDEDEPDWDEPDVVSLVDGDEGDWFAVDAPLPVDVVPEPAEGVLAVCGCEAVEGFECRAGAV